MTIVLKSFCFFIFVSLTSSKIADNDLKEDFVRPRTVRFVPPIKTIAGRGEVDSSQEVKEIPVPRYARALKNCRYPKLTEDSDIFCKIYPSKIICNQTCMFGYTLKEGTKRTMTCRFDEDEWKPVRKFENCKPFVDCTLTLGPGGKMVCHSHFMEHGPICEISCKHYEDKEAVPARKYQCDLKGEWTPKLPFCASPGSYLDLVPRPEK